MPDELIRRYGIITAAVWGKFWRYSNLSRSSKITKKRIAGELGLSVQAIYPHIKNLINDGYLVDITPNEKDSSYILTDKIITNLDLAEYKGYIEDAFVIGMCQKCGVAIYNCIDHVCFTESSNGNSRSSSWGKYSRRLKQSSHCEYCHVLLTPRNRTIDHIVPVSKNGNNKMDNLVACCKSCNSIKHNKELFLLECGG
jgi:biotin operon repressor